MVDFAMEIFEKLNGEPSEGVLIPHMSLFRLPLPTDLSPPCLALKERRGMVVGHLTSLQHDVKPLLDIVMDVNLVKQTINDIVNKTLISADHIIAGKLNSLRIPKGVCYEVFGFDILLDAKLKPWLIEVNAFNS